MEAGDDYYPRAPDHTSFSGSMTVYQIFQNCQCLNDLRVRTFDMGTLAIWLYIDHYYHIPDNHSVLIGVFKMLAFLAVK